MGPVAEGDDELLHSQIHVRVDSKQLTGAVGTVTVDHHGNHQPTGVVCEQQHWHLS